MARLPRTEGPSVRRLLSLERASVDAYGRVGTSFPILVIASDSETLCAPSSPVLRPESSTSRKSVGCSQVRQQTDAREMTNLSLAPLIDQGEANTVISANVPITSQ